MNWSRIWKKYKKNRIKYILKLGSNTCNEYLHVYNAYKYCVRSLAIITTETLKTSLSTIWSTRKGQIVLPLSISWTDTLYILIVVTEHVRCSKENWTFEPQTGWRSAIIMPSSNIWFGIFDKHWCFPWSFLREHYMAPWQSG